MFNEQFNELVKVTLSEEKNMNDQTDRDENKEVVMDESSKSQDSFKIIIRR